MPKENMLHTVKGQERKKIATHKNDLTNKNLKENDRDI